MLDTKALRHAMIDCDCTVRGLANACEISPTTLHSRLNGKTSFKLCEIFKCCERLGLSNESRNRIFFANEAAS